MGDRCEVEPGEKRGVVKFVGRAETVAPGYFVGIQLDEPLGKHDGTYVNFPFQSDTDPLKPLKVSFRNVFVNWLLCTSFLKAKN